MYRIEDKESAIAEIQRLLRITQTRVFDQKTTNAVAEHQKQNNIEVTGIVDYLTFLSILSRYRDISKSEIGDTTIVSHRDFPLYKGSQGAQVEHINHLIRNILNEYNYDLKMPYGTYFGYDTENAVSALYKIFDMPNTAEITSELYNRMLIENKAINMKKEFE